MPYLSDLFINTTWLATQSTKIVCFTHLVDKKEISFRNSVSVNLNITLPNRKLLFVRWNKTNQSRIHDMFSLYLHSSCLAI